MRQIGSFLKTFLAAPFRFASYRNLFYLILSFPLGLLYFIFLVAGIALGIPLLIILVGALILLIVFLVMWLIIVFEHEQARVLLAADVPPLDNPRPVKEGAWNRFMGIVTNPVAWKGLLFLMIKFPFGVITFSILVFFAALTFSLLAAPLVYQSTPYQINLTPYFNWQISSLTEALILMVAGFGMIWVSLNIFNGLAWIWAQLSILLLGNPDAYRPDVQVPPATPAAADSELAVVPAGEGPQPTAEVESEGVPETTVIETAPAEGALPSPIPGPVMVYDMPAASEPPAEPIEPSPAETESGTATTPALDQQTQAPSQAESGEYTPPFWVLEEEEKRNQDQDE